MADREARGMHPNWPSHEDLTRLSRAFNHVADLRDDRDRRINEWLKSMIGSAAQPRKGGE